MSVEVMLFVVVGYAIGRTVGYLVQEQSEKAWEKSIRRLSAIENQFQPVQNLHLRSGKMKK